MFSESEKEEDGVADGEEAMELREGKCWWLEVSLVATSSFLCG